MYALYHFRQLLISLKLGRAEPWMFPKEWQQMGGEICAGSCLNCIMDEYQLVKKLGQAKADSVFRKVRFFHKS